MKPIQIEEFYQVHLCKLRRDRVTQSAHRQPSLCLTKFGNIEEALRLGVQIATSADARSQLTLNTDSSAFESVRMSKR